MMDSGQVPTQDFQSVGPNYLSQGLYKGKPCETLHFRPLSNQRQAYIQLYFLPLCLPPTCDGAHPVQLGPPTLFTEGRTRDVTCCPT